MSDLETLTNLIARIRRQADVEGATTRFPDAELADYANEGIKEWFDFIIVARGWPWYGLSYLTYGTVSQSVALDPVVTLSGNPVADYNILIQITTGGSRGTAVFKWSINGGSTYTTSVLTAASVTLGNTGVVAAFAVGTYTLNNVYSASTTPLVTVSGQQWYELPSDFYLAHTISAEVVGGRSYLIEEMPSKSEPLLRDLSINPSGAPLYYMIQGSRAGRCMLGLFPQPTANVKIRINYFPSATELVNGSDTVDSINGWVEFVVNFGARKVAIKDTDWSLAAACMEEMTRIKKRIQAIANSRSMTEAPKIQDAMAARRLRSTRYWGI